MTNPHPTSPHDCDGVNMDSWRVNCDRAVHGCDDQLPTFSTMGRGIKGDGYEVRIKAPDTISATYLEGWSFDEATKEYTKEWESENINGGHLSCFYNLRPYSIPQCFTMTFVYRRDDRPQWSWTTPAIPYVWDSDGDGNPDTDEIVGSGVGNLWIKEGPGKPWKEKLVFPNGTTAADFNAPGPEETWSGNIVFGFGGDVPLPNLDDIAKILGWSRANLENLLSGQAGQLSGSDNVKDYIDDQNTAQTTAILKHVHDDLGFTTGNLPGDGGSTSVKKYIDDQIAKLNTDLTNKINTAVTNLTELINAQGTKDAKTFTDILAKIYLGGTRNANGSITWPTTDKIGIGNMNLYAGGSANYIKTDADGENDVQVN